MSNRYIEFVWRYFKEAPDEYYLKFADKITSSDNLLKRYYKNGEVKSEIAKDLGMSCSSFDARLSDKKDRVLAVYSAYKESNYNDELLDYLLKCNVKTHYLKSTTELYKKGVKHPYRYVMFTHYYLEKYIDKIEKMPKWYFDFIDDIIERKRFLKIYFDSYFDINYTIDTLNCKESSYFDKLYKYKSKVKEMFKMYILSVYRQKKERELAKNGSNSKKML